jgi:Domain of unknown function (DUF6504)
MSRRYADPIDVRRAGGSAPPGRRPEDAPSDHPAQFLWRGRLYVVRCVIAHWIESSPWWGGSRRALEGAIPPHEHEVWRVEAQAGRSSTAGIYDLRCDLAADRWVLARAMD